MEKSQGVKFSQSNGEQGKVFSLLPLKPLSQCSGYIFFDPGTAMQCPTAPARNLQITNTTARPTTTHLCSPQLPRCCRIPLFCLWDPSPRRAPCPAPHQPSLAWREAALRQFSAPETSGISLGVSQNSPKAPLIPHSCCTPAGGRRRLHPEHPRPSLRRWHSPRRQGIPHPWGSPYICTEHGSFCNTETKQTPSTRGRRNTGSEA